MLFKRETLAGIAAGDIDLAFRRWERARVKPGSRLRTAVGVIEVLDVEQVGESKIRGRDATRAGFESRAALLRALAGRSGWIHRIRVRHAGDDDRVALRQRATVTDDELAEITARLDRLDRASRHDRWTRRVLAAIRDRPATRAPDLAADFGRETRLFKADVRKLKELGLTESLKVGYRLSPRGETVLARLERAAGAGRR